MDILSYLKYKPKPRWVQGLINKAYYDEAFPPLNRAGVDYLVMDKCLFLPKGPLMEFGHAGMDKWFEGLRKEDVFVDLGAFVGTVSIPLSYRCKKVHSIEPLWSDLLIENMRLNRISNMEVWSLGLGRSFSRSWASYGSRKKLVPLVPWPVLRSWIGPIDFLKVDIEGQEWASLPPEALLGVREIRIEFHIDRFNRKGNLQVLEQWERFLKKLYKIQVEKRPGQLSNLRFSDTLYFSASRR